MLNRNLQFFLGYFDLKKSSRLSQRELLILQSIKYYYIEVNIYNFNFLYQKSGEKSPNRYIMHFILNFSKFIIIMINILKMLDRI